MMLSRYIRLIICCLSISLATILASKADALDSSVAVQKTEINNVPPRSFEKNKLEKYKTDKDYQYEQDIKQGESFWEKVKSWFWYYLGRLLFDEETTLFWRIVRYLLVISITILIVSQILKTDFRMLLLGNKGNKPLAYSVENENIHAIDFEKQIQEAIEKQAYSIAVRLYYLKTLKILTDKSFIDWKKEKTNHDYINEMQAKNVNISEFTELTSLFEYAYYGDFKIDKYTFELVQNSFQKYIKQIQ